MEDDDLNFDVEAENLTKKMIPLRGRRSTPHQSPRGFAGPGSPTSGAFSGNDYNTPQPPPRAKKTGGWASDILSAGFARKSKTQALSPQKETPREKESNYDKDDSDGDIPIIPDLEEIKEEDFANQVAHAPIAPTSRVATFQELDNDLLKNSAFANIDGIDLRILMKCLSPESDVKEEDNTWSWDVLFTEVSSLLNEEWEGKIDKDIDFSDIL